MLNLRDMTENSDLTLPRQRLRSASHYTALGSDAINVNGNISNIPKPSAIARATRSVSASYTNLLAAKGIKHSVSSSHINGSNTHMYQSLDPKTRSGLPSPISPVSPFTVDPAMSPKSP